MMTKQHDLIMVVVDNFLKATHFILIKFTHKDSDTAWIFMKGIFWLHGFPKAIVSDCDAKFTSNFWKGLFQDLGM